MLANSLILVASAALFLYWFRYTCHLILSTRTTTDYSHLIARNNHLLFLQVQELLDHSASARLDALHESLERDYALLTFLFSHALELRSPQLALERRMLMIDFRIMRVWFALTSRTSPERARTALAEMAQIVSHIANSMGEQLATI
jgi:hypothetical protein